MSTWTSRKRLSGVIAGVILAFAAGLWTVPPVEAEQAAPRKATVSEGQITISGPSGYCVDLRSSRDGQDGAFVLLGNCAALNGSGRVPRARALLTATVLLGAPPGESLRTEFQRMADFFVTAEGRKALSRDGVAESVRIARIVTSGDVLYILAEDRAPLAGYPVVPEYWRAILALRGRLISLSVLGLPDAPMDSDQLRRLLDRFVSRVLAENS